MVEQSREDRHHAIRDILRNQRVPSQDRLVRLLRKRGHDVTQSSVSRDLKDIGVAKVEGRYALARDFEGDAEQLATERVQAVERVLAEGLRAVSRAGPHLLILHTVIGGASRVALALDQSGWAEALGTIAGDDTIFVATPGLREQEKLRERLAELGIAGVVGAGVDSRGGERSDIAGRGIGEKVQG